MAVDQMNLTLMPKQTNKQTYPPKPHLIKVQELSLMTCLAM